jgi:hypothetical protein
MTRMFKQLVESSRKKLAKAQPAAQPSTPTQSSTLLNEPRRKPDFDVLEGRVLFSGGLTNHGFNRKSVTFTDAWGDSVLVRLVGGPSGARFNIALDGGAPNHADIQNITINGKATAATVLQIYVKPKAFKLAETYTGGVKIVGDPLKTVYAVGNSKIGFTPGLVQIGSIDATTALRGININGGDFQDISDTGTYGIGVGHTMPKHGLPHALPGGIAVDMSDAQFRGGLLYDPFKSVGFGNIYSAGPIGALTLRGRTDSPSSNNLNGSIVVHGAVGSIDARFSDVLAPITATSIGSATFNEVLANVTTTAAIGSFDANNLVASVTAGTTIGNLSLTGSLLGTATATGFSSVSVNGNFTGLLDATASGIGNLEINSGTAFTGTVQATGNIGSVTLSQAATPFSGQVVATGNIGAITAGFFSNAAITAGGSIGKVTSNSTSASVTSGIVNSTFESGAAGIGNISSVASITNSEFTTAAGPIGTITVLQGGLSGDVIGGGPDTTEATTIGAITANSNITGTSVFATTSIASVTSVAGFIGGSSNTASFIKAGLLVNVNLTGLLNLSGVVTVAGGQPGPKADVFIAGNVGAISALGDISGNVITATAGSVGAITSHEGRIAFDAVSATANIGNIYANSQDATFAFDSAGNVLETVASVSGSALTGYTLVPSASAIDHSTFVAGGNIGVITGHASAVGGFFPPATSSSTPPSLADRGIDSSTFSASNQIGKIYATSANTTYHAFETGNGEDPVRSYATGLDAAIFESNFIVSAPVGASGIGAVSAVAIGGPGIYYSTFHASSGNIANVYARSVLNNAMYRTSIEADNGNVGIVKGVVTGGNGTIASDALEGIIVAAGAGPMGTGTVVGIYGHSAHGNGIDHTKVAAGTGGIGYIKGLDTGTIGHAGSTSSSNGIASSTFTSSGPVGAVTGTSSSNSGIYDIKVNGSSIGAVVGVTSGYGTGIDLSGFYATGSIASVTGVSSNHLGSSGISKSNFNADTDSDGSGHIGAIIGSSAGSVGFDGSGAAEGIYASHFYASSGISSITGKVTNTYGGSGIVNSHFSAATAASSYGSIGIIKGTTVGKAGNGISGSHFYAEGISGIYGAAFGAYGANGLFGDVVNADIRHKGNSSLGYVTGYSYATHNSASGILGSTFTAGRYIGAIHGATTAPGNNSYGIGKSNFFANAGASSRTGGYGHIESVTGTANANGASEAHVGIYLSKFVAGAGPESNGHIGDVVGSSTLNGGGTLQAYGIENSTFVAGSDHGTIDTITGYAKAQGGQASANPVFATGILDSGFYAGTGVTVPANSGNGTLGLITGTAIAESAFGAATATGVNDSFFIAGGSGTGRINGLTVSASANGHTTATATGILGSYLQAGVLSGGTGYIGPITATATTHSQGTASAYGIKDTNFWSGYASGTIAGLSSTAKAYGEGRTTAFGVLGYSAYGSVTPIYGFKAVGGGYTLQAGSGVAGTGNIGTVTGTLTATATATSNDGSASAYGFLDTVIYAGHASGTISNITGTATATAEAGTANSIGIGSGMGHTYIYAGRGPNGTGLIGVVTGNGNATSTGSSATAYGIRGVDIKSGLNHGTISGIAGTAVATVTYTNRDSFALAYGIRGTDAMAGYSGNYGKIGNITGTGTATIHSSYENSGKTALATAGGIAGSEFYAQGDISTLGVQGGSGSIGIVKGTGHAYSYGYQVKSVGLGILRTTILASNAANSTGTIEGVYGYGVAKATANTLNATANAYGIGAYSKGNAVLIEAGQGLNSIGHIYGEIYGDGTANAVSNGNAVAQAGGYGIERTTVYAGTAHGGKGYLPVSKGVGSAFAKSATASAGSVGIFGSISKAGYVKGIITGTYGSGTAIADSYDGNANTGGAGISEVTIAAGIGNAAAYGNVGYVKGLGTAHSYAKGAFGNATANAFGIDPTTVSAGSTSGTGNRVAGTGKVSYITGGAYAKATTAGIDTYAHATSHGIQNLTVNLGVATSTNASAFGGSGGVSGDITGTAYSYAKAVNLGGAATASATGIQNLAVNVANATGVGYSKGGTGTDGNIVINTYAKAYGSAKTYALDYGLNGLTISVGNAFAGNASTDLAFGGTGTIGTFSDTQYAKAIAGASAGSAFPGGYAKAYAEPLSNLSLIAGNAYGGVAYGGKGYIAQDGRITGTSDAYASGYKAVSRAIGLATVRAVAGNAIGNPAIGGGSYYAKGGTGNIGVFKGEAKAYSTLIAPYPGSVSNATAYGIDGIKAYAGNASITNPAATLSEVGGHGFIGGFLGYGYSKAYAAKTPLTTPAAGVSLAKSTGIFDVYAYAGNASNFGTGNAKTYYGKISGTVTTKGVAISNASTKGGGTASSEAYAYGIKAISLNAANAATYGGGKAIATKAYAYIGDVAGYGTATSYAYGKTDPAAKSVSFGVYHFTLRAGNAFVEHGGTSNAYGAGSTGFFKDEAEILGLKGVAKAYSTAKGTATTVTPVTADSYGHGLRGGTKVGGNYFSYGLLQAADAFTNGNAYAGSGYIGEDTDISGSAKTTATATAINPVPDPASAKSLGYGIEHTIAQAGAAISYGNAAKAVGDTGKVYTITGTGYGTATTTGDASTTQATGFGISNTKEFAGYAAGLNAYASYGYLGAISGTGKAYGYSRTVTNGISSPSNVHGYGMDFNTFSAGSAIATNYARGASAKVSTITGSGKAIAHGYSGGNVDAYSSGVKNSDVYSGDANAPTARAGVGAIGATNGTGYAKATGANTKTKSFGVDPVKLYAGSAFGVTYARGGIGISTIGVINGTATSGSYGTNAVGYAYGINQVFALAGNAHVTGTSGGDRAEAGEGTIGAITGISNNTVHGYNIGIKSIAISRGIAGSRFNAGYAYGYDADASIGNIAAITGTATNKLTASGYAPNAGIYTQTSYGIESTVVNAGSAVGNGTANEAFGDTGVVGYITGSITNGLYGTVTGSGVKAYAGKIAGIALVTVNAGSVKGAEEARAGAGYIATAPGYLATGSGISGVATVTVNANIDTYAGASVREAATRGIYNSTFNAGSAVATGTSPGYAHGATAVVGPVYGHASTNFTSYSFGTENTLVQDTSGAYKLTVNAGNATGDITAIAGAGTIGNIKGKGYVTFSGLTHRSGTGNGVESTYGLERTFITAATGSASTSNSGATASAGTGNIGTVYGYAKDNITYAHAIGLGNNSVYANGVAGIYRSNFIASNATAEHTADAGAGTIATGGITGKAYITMPNALVEGSGSSVRASNVDGIASSDFEAGIATASTANNNYSALAGAANIATGGVTAKGVVTLTGFSDNQDETIASDGVYGLAHVLFSGGNATGYTATSQSSNIATAGIVARATTTVSATTFYGNDNVYSGQTGNKVVAVENVQIFGSYATANTNGAANAGSTTATIGYIDGIASGTNSNNGSAEGASQAYVRGIDQLTVHAAGAYSNFAHAGSGVIGFAYGKATASAGASFASGNVKTQAYGFDGSNINAGYANGSGTSHAGASSLGAVTGKAYATSTGSVIGGTNPATANGLFSINARIADANGYKAYGQTGSITSITGYGKAAGTGYKTNSFAGGIGTVFTGSNFLVGDAVGGSAVNAIADAGKGTIGAITGYAKAYATGNNTATNSTGYVRAADGIAFTTFDAGYAKGFDAAAGNSSTIGAISGKTYIKATGFAASDNFDGGIASDIFTAGYAKANHGVAHGGTAATIAIGAQIYAGSSVTVTSPTAGTGTVYAKSATGFSATTINAGSAVSGTSTTDKAYATYGLIGGIKGVAALTESATSGASATTKFVYGQNNTHAYAAEALATGYAEAGQGIIGAIYGKADAHLTTGALTGHTYASGSNSIVGIANGKFLAGYAVAGTTLATEIAKGGNISSIGAITGKGYAYANGNTTNLAGPPPILTSSVSKAYAYGITSTTATAGNANADKAYAGSGILRAIYGKAEAKAYGETTTSVSKGIDPSIFSAGSAYASSTKAVASTGTVASIIGYAFAYADSVTGLAHAHATGLSLVYSRLGYATTGGTANVGTVTGAVKGTGEAYANSATSGDGFGYGYGIKGGKVIAGYLAGANNTSSAIGSVGGYGTGSNAAVHTVGGTHTYGFGINTSIYSGGSIGAITARANLAASTSTSYGIGGSTFKAGGAITGTIDARNTATGAATQTAIKSSNFVAATSLSNIYAKDASLLADSVLSSNFRAGTGGVGTVKAYSGTTTSATIGFHNSIVTTSGNIGAITIHGSVLGTNAGITGGFFAGDDLGVGYAIGGTGSAADNIQASKSIGNISISAYFENADIIASITNSASTSFGANGDAASGTGSIGTVTIGKPNATTVNNTAETLAIESHTIGTVLWGSTTVTSNPNQSVTNPGGANTAIRVRAI